MNKHLKENKKYMYIIVFFIFIITYIIFIFYRPIENNIKQEATRRCVNFIKPNKPFKTKIIDISGDNNRAVFKINILDNKSNLICFIDWFNYISHGEYILVKVRKHN